MRFSVLRRTITGFLEVGVWNRFIGFGVNAVGFSTALLLDLHQSGILQLPQGVDRLLPPAVEQFHYLIDGIVEVNAPIFVRPAVLPEKASCPIPAACSSVGTLPGLRDKMALLTKSRNSPRGML